MLKLAGLNHIQNIMRVFQGPLKIIAVAIMSTAHPRLMCREKERLEETYLDLFHLCCLAG